MLRHLQALLVLLAFAAVLILGTPGLDHQDWRDLDEPDERAALREAAAGRPAGPALATLILATADLNRHLRQPLYDLLAPIQRPFRIRQSWHLYRDGPTRVRRLEISVDGRLVHRSSDPAFAWRDAQLRNRHLRPILENVARRVDSPNWRGALRWIVAEARADWPQAERIEVVATIARYPGTEARRSHGWIARAPDWVATVAEDAP
jgi:hypothetical protein